jgi:hypothetical protein
LIRRLLDLVAGAGATSEKESDRDGLLSWSGEYHALEIGLAVGFLAGVSGRWELAVLVATVALGARKAQDKTLREVAHEGWYALSGLLVGAVIGVKIRTIV